MTIIHRHRRTTWGLVLFLSVLLALPVSAPAISIGEEEELSADMLRIIFKKLPLIDDPYVTAYVNRVGKRILTVMPDIYMLGDNPAAARLAGVPTDRMTVLVYALSGLCAALAGLVLIARLDSAQPVLGQGYELDAIAAVVVGGTSFPGGEGTLTGTLLGVLLIETLNNGINLLNIPAEWGLVVKGVVIALALVLYKLVNRK